MLPLPSKKYTKRIRGTHVGYTICLAIGVFVLFFVAFKSTDSSTPATYQFTTTVDTQNKTIDLLQSNPPITTMSKLFTSDSLWPHRISRIFSYIDDLLASIQNIASPTARTVHIRAGMRREQVANAFATGLNWNAIEKKNFLRLSIANAPISEGFYYPDTYVLTIGTNAETVHKVLLDTFAKEISSHYATSTAEKVDMATALKIASILQREAAGHSDMRLISGIIWNRIFRNMSLDMDSTLQYARGTHANGWWPKVRPKDKYIKSPYNTYKNSGLPPTPISNSSSVALWAALNPEKTDCLFYFHDDYRMIHCSTNYADHVTAIKTIFKKN